MSELSHYEKTGYLHDDFKIFHLKDTSMHPIDSIIDFYSVLQKQIVAFETKKNNCLLFRL